MNDKTKSVIWLKEKPYDSTNIKEIFKDRSVGLCLAKFTQGTLHLGTGMTHACHHPRPHVIPIKEITNNPSALFNTSSLKKSREEMLAGDKPSECDYCWRIENSGNASDRYYKSIEPWALSKFDEIINSDPYHDRFPTYLEVDFSNVCNYSCIYCGPEFSTKWIENLNKFGPIKLLSGTNKEQWVQGWQDLTNLTYKNREFNPYVDAFWKWFPEVYNHLMVYRITGGEPLLSKETFHSMDWFINNPNTNLEFSINSNLGAPQKIWDEFIKKLEVLSNGNYVKKFTLFTSIDGWGERAEYLRPGLDTELFKKRFEQVLSLGTVRVTIMCTFNILSITSILDLFKWVKELKSKYNFDAPMEVWEQETGLNLGDTGRSMTDRKSKREQSGHHGLVGLDMPYLRHPSCLDASIADTELIETFLIPAMNYIATNLSSPEWGLHLGFEQWEMEKMKRNVLDIMYSSKSVKKSEKCSLNRAKFYDFVNDIDRRHNKNFLTVFPEMTKFYKLCELENKAIYGK